MTAQRNDKTAKPISLRLTKTTAARLEKFVAKHNQTTTAAIEDAVVEYLDKYEAIPSFKELAAEKKRK